jgi:hypothetical protein
MIGPPALKFRMKKLLLGAGAAGAAGLASAPAAGATAGEVAAAGAAVPDTGGIAGAVVEPGAAATEAPGAALSAGAAAAGEDATAEVSVGSAGVVAGLAAGSWAKLVSAVVMRQRLTISVFFILAGGVRQKIPALMDIPVYHKGNARSSRKSFCAFCGGEVVPIHYFIRIDSSSGLRERPAKVFKASFFSLFVVAILDPIAQCRPISHRGD